MKRTIIAIALLTSLFLPAVSTAQVDYSTLTAEQRIVLIQETEAKLRELITMLITLLQDQLKIAVDANLQQSPEQIQTDVLNPVDTSSQGTPHQTTQNMPQENKDKNKKSITLELFSPYQSTSINRKLKKSEKFPDMENESNYVDIGLIVRENGTPIKDRRVTITATDEANPIEKNGTGTVGKVAINGAYVFVPYYHYHYEFKTSGKHKITFATEGETISVELDVE